ncbi:MAG: 3-deoxy-D-manno-octulosonic acid transferase [Opitutales bacterium]|nr:3-deoxy-D-manno-octulosonic acid transferase [Opitutales bacterium]
MLIWVYRFLFPLLFVLALPFYLLRMLRRKGYREMLAGRVGNIQVPQKRDAQTRIWIQAVSVGELLAIETLIEQLVATENVELVISTTTSTGYKLAKEKYEENAIAVVSFPLDFYLFSKKSWNRISPDIAIITEGEIWPEHIHQAHRRNIPLVLINGRISDRSFRRMQKYGFFKNLAFTKVSKVAASSHLDAQRFVEIGVDQSKVSITGNLKFDAVSPNGMDQKTKAAFLSSISKSSSSNLILLGASTWPGEEEMLIDISILLKKESLPIDLFLVPRHAERRGELRSMLKGKEGIRWSFRSNPDWRSDHTSDEDLLHVYVGDTTGELRKFVEIADVAVIGKSFPPHKDGQTPVEAIALGTPIVYGRTLGNFRAICKNLEEAEACVKESEPTLLKEKLQKLLTDQSIRLDLVAKGKTVFDRSKGSTERTLELIKSYF